MKILVTGHTGFIGSNMFHFLQKIKSVDSMGFSKSTGQNLFNLDQLKKYVKDCDLVYHFAAYAKPGESILHPVKAIETNIKGCLNVLDACKEYNIPLIYPSSCEIYGNSINPIKENYPINPTNPYAASKAAADRICYSYHVSYDLDVKLVRLFNPYGPNQQLNKILPALYFQAKKKKPLTVFGKGKDTRDYVFIEDIVRGLWAARKLPGGDAINLATGRETTNIEIAKLILEMTGSTSKISFVSYPKMFGNIKNQVGSYEKAKKVLGWKPTIELEEGTKRTIHWLDNIEK
jgi:nucleoside-diphosphate-sugar epimerase